MPRIRLVEIDHFRCIRQLRWAPGDGINALIGPGDGGKSTILDAIDCCLSGRRSLSFTDSDFHLLSVDKPISIAVTIGDLPKGLLDFESYGQFLRGFDVSTGTVEEEPRIGLETVITVRLMVDASLEPTWRLYSARAEALGQERHLPWAHRARLAPVRLGPGAGFHLAWRQGSLLSRITDDVSDATEALAIAAREARTAFGERTSPELQEKLTILAGEASGLGIRVGEGFKAMLDADSITLGRGAIALHTSSGVPLQSFGTGSMRLLVAALHRQLTEEPATVLVDELEHGLEPHRIRRLLEALGAKAVPAPSQVFLTTHSAVAIRELAHERLFVVRTTTDSAHACVRVGDFDVQGIVRLHPEALLARVLVVCEGATEVGLVRGLDLYDDDHGRTPLAALGVVPVDARGVSNVVGVAEAFRALGFPTAILRDDDVPAPQGEAEYQAAGGVVFCWDQGCATEDALFAHLPEPAVHLMLEHAVASLGAPTVDDHIKSASTGTTCLEDCRGALTDVHRKVLGKAARSKATPWYKNIDRMERAARDIIGPALSDTGAPVAGVINDLRMWARDAAD